MKHTRSLSQRLLLLAMAVLLLAALLTSCGECNHTWGDWTVSSEPTCEAEGTRTRTCSDCGETESETLAALGHSFGAYVSNNDATCQSD